MPLIKKKKYVYFNKSIFKDVSYESTAKVLMLFLFIDKERYLLDENNRYLKNIKSALYLSGIYNSTYDRIVSQTGIDILVKGDYGYKINDKLAKISNKQYNTDKKMCGISLNFLEENFNKEFSDVSYYRTLGRVIKFYFNESNYAEKFRTMESMYNLLGYSDSSKNRQRLFEAMDKVSMIKNNDEDLFKYEDGLYEINYDIFLPEKYLYKMVNEFQYIKASYSGIYMIKNESSGKMYIGSSKNIFERWSSHFRNLIKNEHHNNEMQKDFINTNGNFTFKILTLEDEDQLLVTEQLFIDKYDTLNNGYNAVNAKSIN